MIFIIQLINKMIQLIMSGNDLVIPSRFITGGRFIGGNFLKKQLLMLVPSY